MALATALSAVMLVTIVVEVLDLAENGRRVTTFAADTRCGTALLSGGLLWQ